MTDPHGAAPARMAAIIALLLVLNAMPTLSTAAISPTLPDIAATFPDADNLVFRLKLMLTTPTLFLALAAPFAGVLANRIGRKHLLVGGFILFAVAGVACGFATSLTTLTIGRAFTGVGAAAVVTAGVTLVGDYFEGARRRRVIGMQAAVGEYAALLFIPLAGVLIAVGGWRWTFSMFAVGAVLAVLAALVVSEPDGSQREGDGRAEPAATLGALAPIYLMALVAGVGFFLPPVEVPSFLVDTLGEPDPVRRGVAIAIPTLTSGTVALLFPVIRARLGFRAIFALMYAGLALGAALIGLSGDYWSLLAALLVMGVGMGPILPAFNAYVIANSSVAGRARAIGFLLSSLFMGFFLSPFVTEPLRLAIGAREMFYAFAALMAAASLLTFAGFGRAKPATAAP
ncbi:MAG: MFS transporter [Caulobacterales bacterium]|nr:MFS transporter [Caulobacterales bacterium]